MITHCFYEIFGSGKLSTPNPNPNFTLVNYLSLVNELINFLHVGVDNLLDPNFFYFKNGKHYI